MTTKRTVVLGVTGSIAAHRAVDVASALTKEGCDVHVVLTANAQRFVSPVAFRTLSRHPVVTELFESGPDWEPAHIRLADAADLLLVAPATANMMAKMSLGLADDALSCVALALNPGAKVLVAPAMNGKMWLHPATQEHVARLRARGVALIGPEEGLLSCGYEGIGRLWNVAGIVERAREMLS